MNAWIQVQSGRITGQLTTALRGHLVENISYEHRLREPAHHDGIIPLLIKGVSEQDIVLDRLMSQSRRLNSVEMACKYPFSLILDVSLDMTILPCCSPSSAIYVPNERLRQGGQWRNTTTYKKSRFPGCTRSSNDGQLSLWKPNCYITKLVGLQQRSRVTGGSFDIASSRSFNIVIGGRWVWNVT
jgi:hypothetical protein